MKYGFEVEGFLLDKDNNPVLIPTTIPKDECGWLFEVRSEPHYDPYKALYLLKAELLVTEKLIKNAGLTSSYVPLMEIPRALKVQAARQNSKGRIAYRNLYGHETHKNSTKLQTASVHVSVSNQNSFFHDKGIFHYPGFIDYARLVSTFDKAFKEEIAKAKRNPGFYEVKSDGRIEYRSLPNDVDLDKVVDVLIKLQGKLDKD